MAANIVLADFKVVKNWQEMKVKSGEDVSTDRQGKYMRIDATTGKAMLGNASSSGEVANLRGIAMSNQAYVGDPVTLLRYGVIDVGTITELTALDFGAPVYLSDTDGLFRDAAGTVSTVIGRVWPLWDGDAVKRGIMIDLR